MTGHVDPRIERTRQRVFEAARRLLREEGIDALSHTRVAEESGVGRATIYRHWPDVTSLVLDTVMAHHPTQATPPEVFEDLPLRDGVHLIVSTMATMLREDPMVPSMLAMLERAEHEPDWAELRRQISRAMGGPMDQLVAAAKGTGELPPDLDVAHAKAMLAGPLFFARLVLGDPLRDDQVQAHVDAWLRAVGHRPG